MSPEARDTLRGWGLFIVLTWTAFVLGLFAAGAVWGMAR